VEISLQVDQSWAADGPPAADREKAALGSQGHQVPTHCHHLQGLRASPRWQGRLQVCTHRWAPTAPTRRSSALPTKRRWRPRPRRQHLRSRAAVLRSRPLERTWPRRQLPRRPRASSTQRPKPLAPREARSGRPPSTGVPGRRRRTTQSACASSKWVCAGERSLRCSLVAPMIRFAIGGSVSRRRPMRRPSGAVSEDPQLVCRGRRAAPAASAVLAACARPSAQRASRRQLQAMRVRGTHPLANRRTLSSTTTRMDTVSRGRRLKIRSSCKRCKSSVLGGAQLQHGYPPARIKLSETAGTGCSSAHACRHVRCWTLSRCVLPALVLEAETLPEALRGGRGANGRMHLRICSAYAAALLL